MADVDVVIVGAGAAGLAAAKTCRSAGLTFKVFEAMNRIGGRAYTSSEHFSIPFDIGCAWIHAADRNPFYPEAQATGWHLHHHDMALDHLYFGKRQAQSKDMKQMANADEKFYADLESYRGADDRLSSIMAKGHGPCAAATYSGPMDFAQDLDEISIEDFRKAEDLEPNYFTKEGFGALVARFGADVPVELNTPVQRIDWSGKDIIVETGRGNVRCLRIIITVSTGVLAFGNIEFYPELPAQYTESFFDLPMGMLTKIPLEISGTRLGLQPFDDLLIERPARHDIYFLSFPFDTDLMIGFVGGDFAWELSLAGEAAARDFAIDRLIGIFGSNVRKHVGRSMMTNWGAEPTVRGAYAAARPGRAEVRTILSAPIDERIYFAGEALAGPLIQTCGGARLSGEKTGREVVSAFVPK
ncbi:MAG: flavin monoamine oxidase family protein [Rhizobiaceae bacterium]